MNKDNLLFVGQFTYSSVIFEEIHINKNESKVPKSVIVFRLCYLFYAKGRWEN